MTTRRRADLTDLHYAGCLSNYQTRSTQPTSCQLLGYPYQVESLLLHCYVSYNATAARQHVDQTCHMQGACRLSSLRPIVSSGQASNFYNLTSAMCIGSSCVVTAALPTTCIYAGAGVRCMSTCTQKRQASRGRFITNVQVGANRIFKAPGKVDQLRRR